MHRSASKATIQNVDLEIDSHKIVLVKDHGRLQYSRSFIYSAEPMTRIILFFRIGYELFG